MTKWKKPSGVEVETNDLEATVEYCISLDWKRAKDMPKKKRKLKTEG